MHRHGGCLQRAPGWAEVRRYTSAQEGNRTNALGIRLGTLCRIGELLAAEWRYVNLDSGEWFIPAKNVKGRGKKQDHHIFLAFFTALLSQVLYC